MNVKVLKSRIEDGNDLYFTVNGRESGLYSDVTNGVFHFTIWYGVDVKNTSDINEALIYPFFGGKSITELAKTINIEFI